MKKPLAQPETTGFTSKGWSGTVVTDQLQCLHLGLLALCFLKLCLTHDSSAGAVAPSCGAFVGDGNAALGPMG